MRFQLKYIIAIKLIRLLCGSWRINTNGSIPKKPSIIAFWHGTMLPVWKYFAFQNPVGLVSPSRDGEILSTLLKSWDYELLRGSSDKNSKNILDELAKINSESFILITPDGPRGPKFNFKKGAVIHAFRSGLPLYLCGVNANFAYNSKKSWDNFCIPVPFSKINLKFSEPIYIPKDSSRDEIEKIIIDCENKLIELEN